MCVSTYCPDITLWQDKTLRIQYRYIFQSFHCHELQKCGFGLNLFLGDCQWFAEYRCTSTCRAGDTHSSRKSDLAFLYLRSHFINLSVLESSDHCSKGYIKSHPPLAQSGAFLTCKPEINNTNTAMRA